jgi:hypothetical protein
VLRKHIVLQAPLLALFALVATREEQAEAADVAPLVEGENFDVKPTDASIVNVTMHQNGRALEFLNDTTIATETATSTRKEGLTHTHLPIY